MVGFDALTHSQKGAEQFQTLIFLLGKNSSPKTFPHLKFGEPCNMPKNQPAIAAWWFSQKIFAYLRCLGCPHGGSPGGHRFPFRRLPLGRSRQLYLCSMRIFEFGVEHEFLMSSSHFFYIFQVVRCCATFCSRSPQPNSLTGLQVGSIKRR